MTTGEGKGGGGGWRLTTRSEAQRRKTVGVGGGVVEDKLGKMEQEGNSSNKGICKYE